MVRNANLALLGMIKRLGILTAMLIVTVVLLSGCVNASYVLKLNGNETVDVNISILFSKDEAGESKVDYEILNELIASLESLGYTVSEKTDKGMSGYQVEKQDIPLDEHSIVEINNYKVDILGDILNGVDFEENMLGNKYMIKSDIDLTKLSIISNSDAISEHETISAEEYKKLLSEMNLKFQIDLDGGAITDTNSTIVAENKKSAQWVLIPGSKNTITLNGTMKIDMSVLATFIILAVVSVLALIFIVVLLRHYRRKNHSS